MSPFLKTTFVALTVACCGAAAWACASLDAIDDSQIPTTPGTPTCDQACNRLAALCGYAPVGCLDQCGDAGFDDMHLQCVGGAPSCEVALACVNATPPDGGDDDAGDDGSNATGDDASDASGDDDASDDAPTDAPVDG